MKIERMWINQPSTLQPLHELHGTRVLAVIDPADKFTHDVYFADNGPTVSMRVSALALSRGWPK